jgi:hypothetical protein
MEHQVAFDRVAAGMIDFWLATGGALALYVI